MCDQTLTVVVPAYNEAKRLPTCLERVKEYLVDNWHGRHEVLIVDDGGSDNLGETLKSLLAAWPELHCIRHSVNRGKGAAIRCGIRCARGDLILTADADGATPIEEERKLRKQIDAGADLAVGSRTAHCSSVSRQRTLLRRLASFVFRLCVKVLTPCSVHDTQCGFKMVKRSVARRLMKYSQEDRFLFDVEVLVLADRMSLRVDEVPVSWSEKTGGTINLWRDSPRMVLRLFSLGRRIRSLKVSDNTRFDVPNRP